MDVTQWDGQLVRELLVVLYGGHHSRTGGWVPEAGAVGRYRKVSARTVRRWTRPGSPAAIPARVLEAMLARRQPRAATLRREQLQADRTEQMRVRAGLGRGRGNLQEYAARGWLEQHRVLVLEEAALPLRRITVVRDDPTLVRRAVSGSRVVDLAIADTKFAGDALRYRTLNEVRPWRLELSTRQVAGTRGRTQVWLASAPLSQLPLQANLVGP
ncbi:hypothetical protein [uncultured Cellulomonas sp.]|uniref:hypothetical protein n=1 Tax=uncultured Cellulomonas sp. TaxID=189682 RepID=UPI002624019D|nr:hypothetical protein [uncultured Cellulomonas sp.]